MANTHGGKRPGAGRPSLPEAERGVKVSVRLRPGEIDTLKQIGDGILSLGIRRIISHKPSVQSGHFDDIHITE